jgi:hypothetical protein
MTAQTGFIFNNDGSRDDLIDSSDRAVLSHWP